MKKQLQFLTVILIAFGSQSSFSQVPYIYKHLDINNINATISPSGHIFRDSINAGFEVPAGSGIHAIYMGGIWVGGLDPGENIHMGAQTYNQIGIDFSPGPFDTTLSTGPVPSNYLNYLSPWKVNASEVDYHIQHWNDLTYIMPSNIAEWPGYDTSVNRIISPFADYNSNGIYDPMNGDYPYILGDQSVYAVFNDSYPDTANFCDNLGIEVHREFFGFDAAANTPLDNSVFARYYIKNFSNINYHDLYVSMWTDFDLGNSTDDYIGTDLALDMVYVYNGDSIDQGPNGYGLNPPAVGVYFLNQNLSSSLAYNNVNNVPTGNPTGCVDNYNYMRGIWLDNQPVTYGADGRNASNPVTTFMYPGITDSTYYPTLGEWSEITAGNTPEDRRALAGIGPFNMIAGAVITFDVGYTWAQAASGGPLASVVELQNAVQSLRIMYNNGLLLSDSRPIATHEKTFSVYPNPATNFTTIKNLNPGTPYSIVLQDAVGRILLKNDHVTDESFQIETSSYSDGIYFISIYQNGGVYNQKLIIR